MPSAIFLDRDGVIIENRPNYVKSWDEVLFLPMVLETMARLKNSPFKMIIITNQAGIGRGKVSRQVVDQINLGVQAEIEKAGGRIDAIYICPHTPEDGCACRKPRPGMIIQAAEELQLELQESILIGDNLSDIQAGLSAGVGRVALVRTGLGDLFASQLPTANLADIPVFKNLAQAVDELLELR